MTPQRLTDDGRRRGRSAGARWRSARRVAIHAALACGAFVPAFAAEHQRFVVLGHLRGDANGSLLQNLDEVVEAVRREEPDVVFLCGDLIWGDVDRAQPADPAVIRADWERLDAALLGVGVPIYRVPGNHDVCDLVTRDAWVERYGTLPRQVDVGRTRFLLMNSGWWPEDGDTRKHPQEYIRGKGLDSAQLAFLEDALRTPETFDHAFVFLHHLLWWEDDAGWWRRAAPLFADRPVRAVFSGDYGPLKFAHMVRDGVHYLQTSIENKVSTQMLRGREASRLLSAQLDNYVVVDIDGMDVRYSVRAIGALSTGKFSPQRYREVVEYDQDSYGAKLMRRWSTPDRLRTGVMQVSALFFAFGAGLALALGWMLRRSRGKGP